MHYSIFYSYQKNIQYLKYYKKLNLSTTFLTVKVFVVYIMSVQLKMCVFFSFLAITVATIADSTSPGNMAKRQSFVIYSKLI